MERSPGTVSRDDALRPLALALDLGSSSLRSGLYDAAGRRLEGTAIRRHYAWELTPDGGFSRGVAALLDEVGALLDRVAAELGPLLSEAVVAGTSCFFHSLAALDQEGRPLSPLLSWADTRAADAAAQLATQLDAEAVRQRTGVPLHASYWPAKIGYLRGVLAGPSGWAGLPSLLAEHLTGRRRVGISIAAGTGLLDRRLRTWDRPLLDHLGIPVEQLPELVADELPLGSLTAEAARRWPQLGHLTWYPAWGDGLCGNIGLDCNGPQRAALMIGTSGAVRVILDEEPVRLPRGLFGLAFGETRTLVGGQTSEGGAVLAAMARLLNRPIADLDMEAAALAPVGDQLALLPFLAGERSLGYHPDARGAIDGLRLATRPVELYRATQEAIAYRFAAIEEALEELLAVPPAITAAGGALERSIGFAQVLTDVLQRPVELALAGEPSSRGAAVLALRLAGAAGSLAPIPVRRLVPDAATAADYRAGRARQEELYRRVHPGSRPSDEGPSAVERKLLDG
jgi:gluconokinase